MIAITDLAEIYGEGGTLQHWSQLAASHPACASGRIIRVGRQHNSGTFAYFSRGVPSAFAHLLCSLTGTLADIFHRRLGT